MFSHRISCAVLDSMHTESLRSGLHEVMLEHGWKISELSFNPGSSLITAINQTVQEVHGMTEDESSQDQQELDPAAAAAVVRNLSEAGFKLRPPGPNLPTDKATLNPQFWGSRRYSKPAYYLASLGCPPSHSPVLSS